MRIALVGMDSFYFTTALAGLLRELAGAQWVACCDLGVAAGEAEANTGHQPAALAGQNEVPLFHDLETMLTEVVPDAAIVATNPRRAAGAIAELSERGLHLYIVKPAVVDRRSLKTLRARLAGKDQVILSGPTYRCHPTVLAARDRVASGTIGAVTAMRAMHQHGKLSTWPAGSWYRTDPGVSPAIYLGWYVVDLAYWFAGNNTTPAVGVCQWTAWGSRMGDLESPHPDTIRALCRHRSGMVSALDIYFGVSSPFPDYQCEILGTQGGIALQGGSNGVVYSGGREIALPASSPDLLAVELAEWVRACTGKARPWMATGEWLEVLEGCLDMAESLQFPRWE